MTHHSAQSILQSVGAIHTDGHFAYTSGRHGTAYINKDAIYPHTDKVQALCTLMATPFLKTHIDTVAGPTIGGVILGQWLAHILSRETGREVLSCFAEERMADNGDRERYFGRDYERWITGHQVLIVEDILTTGGSARRVVEAVRKAGGTPVAVQALCNRGGVTQAQMADCPVAAIIDLQCESWLAKDCPLCQRGVPISTELGKGK